MINGHKNYFESMEKRFELGIKYCFEDVLQINEQAKVEKITNDKYDEIKNQFLLLSTTLWLNLIEKVIASGSKVIPMGEETGISKFC